MQRALRSAGRPCQSGTCQCSNGGDALQRRVHRHAERSEQLRRLRRRLHRGRRGSDVRRRCLHDLVRHRRRGRAHRLRQRLRRSRERRQQLRRLQLAVPDRGGLRERRVHLPGRRCFLLRAQLHRYADRSGELRRVPQPVRAQHALHRRHVHRRLQHGRRRDPVRSRVREPPDRQPRLRLVRNGLPGRKRRVHQRNVRDARAGLHAVRGPPSVGSETASIPTRTTATAGCRAATGARWRPHLQRRGRAPSRALGLGLPRSAGRSLRRSAERQPWHCGLCSQRICGGNLICSAGQCACPTGTVDCSGTCSDLQTDSANCGTCGTQCIAGQGCVTGTCQ